MNQPFLPDIFQTKLTNKYHSARLDQIKNRKIYRPLKDESLVNLHNNNISYNQQERLIAIKNQQLGKRLAEVRYKPSQIARIWLSNEAKRKNAGRLSQHKPYRNYLKQWERLVQNQRLGKSLDVIKRRKKNMILPED